MTGIGEALGGMNPTVLSAVLVVVNALGLPGLLLLFWYVDQRRTDALMSEFKRMIYDLMRQHKDEVSTVLGQYKEDVTLITRYYENNVILVENYNKLSNELSNIIQLNTQVLTQLSEQVKNNSFCPVIRESGPGRK